MRCLAAGVVISLILINVALGDLSTQNTKFIYHMDQKVKGNGFFNSHGDTNTYDLQMSNNGHGSGSYDYESKVFAMKEAKYNEGSQNYDYDTRERQITMNESVDYAFSPIPFSFGKSFHSGAFESLGGEETSIENYGEPISMVASFDTISTMSKNISANLYWKNTTTDATDQQLTELDYTDVLNTEMNIDAAFSGKAHIGVTGMDDIGEPTNPIKAPSVRNLITNNLIDEDYLGTFHIVKKMSQDSTYKRHQERDDWLPCCSSGFADMSPSDQKPFKSAKGIFDCTCFKVPSIAQWPRVYA